MQFSVAEFSHRSKSYIFNLIKVYKSQRKHHKSTFIVKQFIFQNAISMSIYIFIPDRNGLFLLSMHICWNANARIRDDKSPLPTTIQNTNSEERSYRKDSQKHFCNTTLYPAVV